MDTIVEGFLLLLKRSSFSLLFTRSFSHVGRFVYKQSSVFMKSHILSLGFCSFVPELCSLLITVGSVNTAVISKKQTFLWEAPVAFNFTCLLKCLFFTRWKHDFTFVVVVAPVLTYASTKVTFMKCWDRDGKRVLIIGETLKTTTSSLPW